MNHLLQSAALALVVVANCPMTMRAAEVPAKPVLLLTGFEPFGPGRPKNSSWEGISVLDGSECGGFKIVCREMKVEWGAPLEQLDAWIDELQPAAVMSFGQGGAAFAIETRARNARGRGADNNGDAPSTPLISDDGPEEFAATIDARALVSALSNDGYEVQISRDAGQYLCEETLYALELLKQRGRIPGDVLFCHVPPLKSEVRNISVTAEFIIDYVRRLVIAWVKTQPEGDDRRIHALPVLRQAAADPREQDVREFIDRYFRTWSAKDMERYGQCFMPQAAIQLVDPAGKLITMPLRPFLESQREGHRKSVAGMTEAPEAVEIRFEGRVARVVVFWKLVEGDRTEFGYDHYTLMQSDGKWRIANLLFYATPEEERPK